MRDLCSVYVECSSGYPCRYPDEHAFLGSCCGHVGVMSGPRLNVRLGTYAGTQMIMPFGAYVADMLGPGTYVGPKLGPTE